MRLPKINFWLLGILALVVLLRVPSFFEPHWYGDEEIYLVLGQMMRRGAVLYRDIWDNKTPLLYLIYSISPTLVWAKLTATLGVLGTTLGVYGLAKKLFEDRPIVYCLLPTALVGVLLSLPILEGNVANAELYFTLPIIMGAILTYRLLTSDQMVGRQFHKTAIWVGILAAIAFLLKVPAIFDLAGLLLGLIVIKFVEEYWSPTRNYKKYFSLQFKSNLFVAAGFLAPIFLIFIFFWANYALSDFAVAAFSQNASYVAIDSGPFSKLSNPLFIKAFLLLLASLFLLLLFVKKLFSREVVFLSFWFGFSLYGALLSNRPYNHYLLQSIPPVTILIIYLVAHLKRYWAWLVLMSSILYFVFWQFRGAFALNSGSYYRNFWDWASERIQWIDYVSYFDSRTEGNYIVANFINENTKPNDPIFVWGDVASIYTISERPAATKFIQAHHLTTIGKKNYDQIISRLLKFQPKYIVVSRPVQFPFPSLEMFLSKNYRQVKVVGSLSVYQNIAPLTPTLWRPHD